MKKIYRFNTHTYAPELNKFEIWNNNDWVEYKLPNHVTRDFTKDYKSNLKKVREYQKITILGSKVEIYFTHSYEPFNEHCNVKRGRVKNARELLEFIKLYKSKNEGEKSVFIRLDDIGNSIYKTVNNTVDYKVKYIK